MRHEARAQMIINSNSNLLAASVRSDMQRLEVEDGGIKAAIYGLNYVGRSPRRLGDAWLVSALVREDGLSQVEAADLLGRYKSWVCRRLAQPEPCQEPAPHCAEMASSIDPA